MPALVVILLASAFWTAGANAQSMSGTRVFGRYQQTLWQEREGLPQNTVLAVTKTRDGYLWLATYEGAARFDGVRFTLFNASNTAGLGNSMVNDLLETRDGHLWLATYGGGISRLAGGRFTPFTTRDGLSSDYAVCLFEDRDGTLWIGTENGATALRGAPSPRTRLPTASPAASSAGSQTTVQERCWSARAAASRGLLTAA